MPCYTVVKVEVENTEWTKKARKKLGLPATGKLYPEEARAVTLEAGKLKAEASILEQDPFAIIEGMEVGSKELTIDLEIPE
jgi:hypothetical protein